MIFIIRSGRDFFAKLDSFVVGAAPSSRWTHPQHLVNAAIKTTVNENLPSSARAISLLDVGCGSKPYQALRRGFSWTGIDVTPGSQVDFLIEENVPWPFEENSFDFVLCTEVLEHARDVEHVVSEMTRVVRVGGQILVTVPFLYPLHGLPHDYRRMTPGGLKDLFRHAEVEKSGLLGGVGSAVVTLWNNWMVFSAHELDRKTGLVGLLLRPVIIVLATVLNILGWLVDRIDRTRTFGTNSFLLANKPPRALAVTDS